MNPRIFSAPIGSGWTVARRTQVAVCILLGFVGRVGAQTVETGDVAKAPTVEEALRSAVESVQGAETADAGEVTPAMLEEINRRLSALQAADPTHPWLNYLYGRTKALRGQRSDAIGDLQRFVQTREGRNEWEAHRRLGDLFADEFPRLAKASFDRAGELKVNEATVLVGQSTCAYKIGQLDDAVRLARQAADADGRKTVRIVAHLARMLIAKELWTDADRAVNEATELAEAAVKARNGARGPLLILDSQYQLGVDLLQSRINAKVAGADDYLRFAALVRKRNDLAGRLNLHDCLRVVELGVKSLATPPPRLLQEYGELLMEVGRTDDAVAAFEKLLAVDPANVQAKQRLEQLHSAEAGKTTP